MDVWPILIHNPNRAASTKGTGSFTQGMDYDSAQFVAGLKPDRNKTNNGHHGPGLMASPSLTHGTRPGHQDLGYLEGHLLNAQLTLQLRVLLELLDHCETWRWRNGRARF